MHKKWSDKNIAIGHDLARRGMTDYEIALYFKVSIATIKNWKSEHPEFGKSLKLGKGEPDEKVKRSLYERAIGYSYETEKIFCQNGVVTKVPYTEHVPPDVTACIFWLKNRLPEEFRDKIDLQHGGNVTVEPVSFADALERTKPANAA